MNKKEAREILFTLVYEYEFNREKDALEIYEDARTEREFENYRYIKKGLSDIVSKRGVLSDIIEKYSDGWKVSRIAPVTRAVLLVATYDMICKSTSCGIAINEAVEIAKKYDDPAAVPFVNGILNSIAKDTATIKENLTADSDTENISDTNIDVTADEE
ncbi:MAG: transcription antitermination factor NusB [Ruminococcaceae bacterium]|nr:transcription antitermination factor NusB [Oscillospiraceae bacterium]